MAQIKTGIQNIQFIDLGVTPTETGNTTFTMAGNQMQWYPFGNRVQVNVGGNLYYGTVISSSYTSNTGVTLRFDAGNAPLTGSLSAVATGFPSATNHALPETVFRHKNLIRNSLMDIWQRPVSVTGQSFSSGSVNYTADGWKLHFSISSAGPTLAVSRAELSATTSNVPTLAQVGVYVTNSLRLSCNAATGALGSGDVVTLEQPIEGFDYRQVAGKPLTVSFWVNSQITGTYCVAMANAGADHFCVQEYSISSVATWEKKIVTFPKPPTSGTWDYSMGVGLHVVFCLAAGSSWQGGAGNWTAGSAVATSNQVNFMGSASKTFMMTAVKVEEGLQATPLEPYTIQDELDRNKRYLVVLGSNGNGTGSYYSPIMGYALTTSRVFCVMQFAPEMRTVPSLSVINALTSFNLLGSTGATYNLLSIQANAGGTKSEIIDMTVVDTALTQFQGTILNYSSSASGSIIFKAEL